LQQLPEHPAVRKHGIEYPVMLDNDFERKIQRLLAER
jgi:hypothetical protein